MLPSLRSWIHGLPERRTASMVSEPLAGLPFAVGELSGEDPVRRDLIADDDLLGSTSIARSRLDLEQDRLFSTLQSQIELKITEDLDASASLLHVADDLAGGELSGKDPDRRNLVTLARRSLDLKIEQNLCFNGRSTFDLPSLFIASTPSLSAADEEIDGDNLAIRFRSIFLVSRRSRFCELDLKIADDLGDSILSSLTDDLGASVLPQFIADEEAEGDNLAIGSILSIFDSRRSRFCVFQLQIEELTASDPSLSTVVEEFEASASASASASDVVAAPKVSKMSASVPSHPVDLEFKITDEILPASASPI